MSGLVLAFARLSIALMALRIAANDYILWLASYIQQATNDSFLLLSIKPADRASVLVHEGQMDALVDIIGMTGHLMLLAAVVLYALAKRSNSWMMAVLAGLLMMEASVAPQFWIARAVADAWALGAYAASIPVESSGSLFFLGVQALGVLSSFALLVLVTSKRRSAASVAPNA